MASPWIKAIRLRTLPLAWASLTMGGILAHMDGLFNWLTYGLSLATAFSLQILSNLANDYGDAVSGLDGESRVGPSRTIQEGLITKSQMKRAIAFMAVLSFGLGLSLIYLAFGDWRLILAFLILGLLSIWAAVKYTMGENPYGYSGWGDFFVLVFFGWVGVSGSHFLYSEAFDWLNLLPATTLGLLAVAVLNVNNIRDIESDQASGKYSIPVRIGRKNAVIYHALILISAIGSVSYFAFLTGFSGWQWLFLVSFPLLIINWVAVKKHDDPRKLDPFLKQMALTTLLFVILFFLGNVSFG